MATARRGSPEVAADRPGCDLRGVVRRAERRRRGGRPFWLVFTGGVGAAVAGRRSRRHTVGARHRGQHHPGMDPSQLVRPHAGRQLAAAFIAPVAGIAAAGALLRIISALPLRAPGRLDVTLAVVTGAVMLLSVTAAVRWILTDPTPQGATAVLTRTDQLAPGHTAWGVVIVLLALAATVLVGMRRVLRGRRRPPFDSAGVAPSAAT